LAAQLNNLEDIAQSLSDARDAASGVSVDEEMMTILQSQRIYQSLTKYVKSLDSAYSDLFRIL
jgi:flagellar hook-associated protein FlgK